MQRRYLDYGQMLQHMDKYDALESVAGSLFSTAQRCAKQTEVDYRAFCSSLEA
jgi:hypothetical protein